MPGWCAAASARSRARPTRSAIACSSPGGAARRASRHRSRASWSTSYAARCSTIAGAPRRARRGGRARRRGAARARAASARLCAACARCSPRSAADRSLGGRLCRVGDGAAWTSSASASISSRCAATGVTDDLVYVSPRSGQAVSAAAGAPYREKLLRAAAVPARADAAADATPVAARRARRACAHRVFPRAARSSRRIGRKLPAARIAVLLTRCSRFVTIAGSRSDPRCARRSAAGEMRDVDFADALGERYLSYALSTIISRSLPDVRDGLKPVHRRLLYAMRAAQARSRHRATRNARASSATSSASSIRMATSRSTTRWCAWRRISRSAIRWSTGRAISAISTAITPRPCATPRAA